MNLQVQCFGNFWTKWMTIWYSRFSKELVNELVSHYGADISAHPRIYPTQQQPNSTPYTLPIPDKSSFLHPNHWRTEGGLGFSNPPFPKFRRPSKIVPNLTRLWKLLKIAEFRMPTLQNVRKKGSKILKLPPVRNCFTLAMTNKFVVIINSLKVPKIKKHLLHETKFPVPNYSSLQNLWLGGGGLLPPDPRFLISVLNLICWTPPPPEKIPGYATNPNYHAQTTHDRRWPRLTALTVSMIYTCTINWLLIRKGSIQQRNIESCNVHIVE